ncbi:hypothetical protein ACIPUA_17950 [Providencia sp. AGC89]
MSKKMDLNGTPNPNSTPSSSSDNSQLQWVMQELNRLSASHSAIKITLENHITSITNKVEVNHEIIKDRLDDKCDNLNQKIADKHDTILTKIDDKNDILRESILRSEQTVINKIKDNQSANIRWLIGIAVAAGIALYKVFSS